jgi:hypothetical protein
MAMESESEEKAAALAHLKSAMSDLRALRQSVSPVEVENAITAIVAFLRTDWHTGGGRRLQQFVWSLWNMEHLVNLYDLASYSVAPLTEAVIVLFRAAMVDVLTEAQKRRLLTDSGELARWKRVCEETPEDEEVLYPGLPASGEFLMKLAVSAQRSEKRAEDARRSALQKTGIDGGAGEQA